MVEKKYAGWTGVLRAWVCSQWSPSGSFITWLNRCASEFEKNYPGVYLEFTNVSQQAVREAGSSGLRPPELLFFSPDTVENLDSLLPVNGDVRAELLHPCALPVCMGGYIWVINPAITDNVPDAANHLPDEPGRCFSHAALLLDISPSVQIDLPDPGVDLGLPAFSEAEITLDYFVDGKLPALLITQSELARLVKLRDSGKGPDWRCLPCGGSIYADQLLLGGIPYQSDQDANLRTPLAEAFLQFLLTDECQAKLADIGAFSTTGLRLYPASSAYAPLEGMIASLPLVLPDSFSEQSSGNQ